MERLLGIKEDSDISTADLFQRYKRHQKPRIKAESYTRTNGILDTLVTLLPVKAREITPAKVAELVGARSEAVSPASVYKELTILKHCLKLATEWGLLNENAAGREKLPNLPEGRIHYLSPPELRATLDMAPEWMRAPIALAAFTAMRRAELVKLKWTDIDLVNRRLYLTDTKNGTLRVLSLNNLAYAVLSSLPSEKAGGLVFPEVDPSKLSVYTKRIFARLGLKDASFHTLRHTAASWLAMSGVDLYAVGQVLGHKDPRMTRRYSHLSPEYMSRAVGTLDHVFAGVLPAAGEPVEVGGGLDSGVTVALPPPSGGVGELG